MFINTHLESRNNTSNCDLIDKKINRVFSQFSIYNCKRHFMNLVFSYLSVNSFFKSGFIVLDRAQNARIVDLTGSNYLIRSTVFNGLSSNGGGAIYLSSITCNIFIEYCLFNACFSTNNDGAVFVQIQQSSIIIDKTCAFYCYSKYGYDYMGQFGRIQVDNSNIIVCQYMSITQCSPFSGHSSNTLILYGGNTSFIYSNSSKNYLYRHSGVDFVSGSGFYCGYSTLSNNVVVGWTVSRVFSHKGQYYLTNIVGNNSPDSRGIFLLDTATIKFDGCCIQKNLNTLFDIRTSTSVTLLNCFVDSLSYLSSKPTTSNITITKYPTYSHIHYQDEFCHADNPIYEISHSQKLRGFQGALIYVLEFICM